MAQARATPVDSSPLVMERAREHHGRSGAVNIWQPREHNLEPGDAIEASICLCALRVKAGPRAARLSSGRVQIVGDQQDARDSGKKLLLSDRTQDSPASRRPPNPRCWPGHLCPLCPLSREFAPSLTNSLSLPSAPPLRSLCSLDGETDPIARCGWVCVLNCPCRLSFSGTRRRFAVVAGKPFVAAGSLRSWGAPSYFSPPPELGPAHIITTTKKWSLAHVPADSASPNAANHKGPELA
ncbi:hypothetical protein CC78DRAFT_588379 [Lojkania enalia]|uniref:Uncharacterized protein n=1 Tax=Lojkania enalia TaxID=147567 RepID=A0A9P4N3X1_9PLEO|nr:hypothetical protein CC78DRAFT_588379 [Didymosphaeria enalia]